MTRSFIVNSSGHDIQLFTALGENVEIRTPQWYYGLGSPSLESGREREAMVT